MENQRMLDPIEEGIQALRDGKVIIVVDDEDRENEGDFICAAEDISPEIINFMAKEGRGLICAALTEERCEELELELMVGKGQATNDTSFTVSVDLIGQGCTTGISAADRSKTVQALVNKNTKPADLGRPGHIFPLKAKKGGVIRRAGHTEAAVDLARIAGKAPAGVLVEIMNEDGSMARLPDLRKVADRLGLKLVSIEDLIAYRLHEESLIKKEVEVQMPTAYGNFKLTAYTQTNTGELHLALVKGTWEKDEPVLLRVHSSCVTGDIFGSLRSDLGEQLQAAMQQVEEEGKGVILYMNQDNSRRGLLDKLKAYKLQDEGSDTADANTKTGMDNRDYGVGAQIIRDLGVSKIRLLSNNPKRRAGLLGYGLEIVDTVPVEVKPNSFNEEYLKLKREHTGHEVIKDY